MRLNTFTDYALRVLMYLAAAPDGRATIARIAKAFAISEHHLVKVVHRLGQKGILLNTRGRGGGLRLARPAAQIGLGSVVRFAEGADLPAECFDGTTNTCVLAGGCTLQGALRRAVQAFYAELDKYSVADLRAKPRKVQAMLRHHPPA